MRKYLYHFPDNYHFGVEEFAVNDDRRDSGRLTIFDAPSDELHMVEGELFEIPGVRGRIERVDFGTGLTLRIAELNVQEEAYFAVQNSIAPGWIGGSWNILGDIHIQPPGQSLLSCSEDEALLMRVDTPGTRYLLPAGQWIRHVGVTCTLASLAQRFGEAIPERLAPFLGDGEEEVAIRKVEVSAQLRNVASSMFSRQLQGPGRRFQLEALSILFLHELIEGYCGDPVERDEALAEWELAAHSELVARIQAEPGAPLVASQLAEEMGLTENRLNTLFKLQTGKRFAEFLRSERMLCARRLLEEEGVALKQVAQTVGFNHVSNFSRAYKRWFGENPGRTLRRP